MQLRKSLPWWTCVVFVWASAACGGGDSGHDTSEVSDGEDVTEGTDGRPDGCLDMCTLGARICSGAGYRECVGGAGGCTDFGDVQACPTGEVCSGGTCGASCRDVCSDGDRVCSGAGFVTCARQASGCLDWNEVQPCPMGESCTDGACSTSCVDQCTSGARQCYAAGWQ